MIKRVVKKKESKQGAILVLVVLILALAMIFITSAMMLTQATRGRLYEEAMQSQARLTVTSASEVFLEALQTQEITDAQLDKMLSETPTQHDSNDDKIRMVIDGVPGMASKDDDPDDENCTFLDLYYPDTSDKTIVHADFTTTIGEDTENVRIVLKVEPQGNPKSGDRFTNQVEVASDSTAATLRFTGGIGMVNNSAVTPTDNTILFRGNATEEASSSVYYSDVIFAPGATSRFGGGNKYYGDIVFLEGAYMSSLSSVGEISGDFYFIGTSNDGGFKHDGNDNIWGSIKSTNFIFAGRRVQNDPTQDQNKKIEELVTGSGKTCYFVSNGGSVIDTTAVNKQHTYTVTNTGTLSDEQAAALAIYENYDYNPATDPFPDSMYYDVFMKMNPDGQTATSPSPSGITLDYDTYSADGSTAYPKNTAIPAGASYVVHPLTTSYPEYKYVDGAIPDSKKISFNPDGDTGLQKWDKKDGTEDRIIELEPGYYYITGGKAMSNNNNKTPYVFAINGARGNEYRFYFAAGSVSYMHCICFAMYSVDNSNPSNCIFILESGAKVYSAESQYQTHSTSLCSMGFISISRGKSTAKGIGQYVQTTPRENENTAGTGYSAYYDNVAKPAMFIFGAGSGTLFEAGCDSVFEAYIGLYEDAVFSYRTDIGDKVWIYGRLEASDIPKYNTTGDFYMPYCPKPTSVSKLPNNRPAETKYKVQNIIYYYAD